MLKYVVVLALFLAVAWADDAAAVEPSSTVEGEDEVSRLFATRTTSTISTWKTSAVSTATTSCATLSNATTACRRRRGIAEQPILLSLDDEEHGIKPSAIVPLETTAAPVAEATPARLEASEFNEDGLIEIDVKNYKNCATPGGERSALNFNFITIVYTTTTTAEYSSTTTSTKTYTVANCSPSGIVTCAASG